MYNNMNSILNKTLAIKIRQDLGVDHYTYGAPEEKAWDSACEGVEKMLKNCPTDELLNALDNVLTVIEQYNSDEWGNLTWGEEE